MSTVRAFVSPVFGAEWGVRSLYAPSMCTHACPGLRAREKGEQKDAIPSDAVSRPTPHTAASVIGS